MTTADRSAAAIVPGLLHIPALTALVGSRIALVRLPQGTAHPALVWDLISDIEMPYLPAEAEAVPVQARVQLNPLAKTVGEVRAIHAAIHAAWSYQHGTVVQGLRITQIRRELLGPFDQDPDTGVWTRPADYLIRFEPA